MPRERAEAAIERGLRHWEAHGYGVWAVCDLYGGDLIGHCGLRFLEEAGETELLYAFARSHWGRGLATEAARATVRFWLERTDLDRIIALAVPQNVGSTRVMEKLGMRPDGRAEMFGLQLVRYVLARELAGSGLENA